ncbi:MAG: type IV secretion system protein [Alphaproteobacteria bacterium]|nr:type IV secretion system protein [Alphaproteobacteria bacterium]
MNMPQLETGKETLAISGTVSEPKYLNELEKERNTIKQIYYLWVSRFFILTATISCAFLMLASLSLFRLAPMVTVEPFLLINQNTSDGIVRHEAIERDMASKDKLLTMFIKQYVVLRNTIINDPVEMRSRWMGGGMLNYLSSPDVYNEFGKATKSQWESIFKQVLVREVEIISIVRQGGERSAVWKVDFKTYDLYNEGNSQEQKEATLRVRYWTASVIAYFIPERAFMVPRLINPLGFTVTRYSQTEVEVL